MDLRKALNRRKKQKKDRIKRYNDILPWEKMKRRTLFSNYQTIYYNKDNIQKHQLRQPALEIRKSHDKYTIFRYKIFYKLDKPFIYWERQTQLQKPITKIIKQGAYKGLKETFRYKTTTNFREFRNINDLFKYIKLHDILPTQINDYIRNNKDLNIYFRAMKLRKLK